MLKEVTANQSSDSLRRQRSAYCAWDVDSDRRADDLDFNRVDILLRFRVRRGHHLCHVYCWQSKPLR